MLAHLQHDAKAEQAAQAEALSTWKANPEVDSLIGKKLSQKYRFAEGEAYQRRALAFDPAYLPAKMQLGQDLLRLGKEAEGWKLAEEVFEADPYNVMAHNLATLRDRLNKFTILIDHGFVVRMDAVEATIYGRRVLELLKDAKEKLTQKYDAEAERTDLRRYLPPAAGFRDPHVRHARRGGVFGRVLRAGRHHEQPGGARRFAFQLGIGALARVLPRRHL